MFCSSTHRYRPERAGRLSTARAVAAISCVPMPRPLRWCTTWRLSSRAPQAGSSSKRVCAKPRSSPERAATIVLVSASGCVMRSVHTSVRSATTSPSRNASANALAVVAPPVVGVQRRDGADVVRGRRPNFHAPPMLARQGPTPRRFSPSRAGPGRTRPGQARRRSAGPDAVRSRTGDRGPEVAAA